MADYDGSIRIGAELDTSGATKELTNLTGELEKSASSAGQIGENPASYTARQYRAACSAFSLSPPYHAAVM